MTESLAGARGARWPLARLVGAALQWAALAVLILGRDTFGSVIATLAMLLAGRGVRVSRSLTRDRMFTTLKYALAAAAGVAFLAVAARVPAGGRYDADAHRSLPIVLALVGLAALAHMVLPMRDLPEPDDAERRTIASMTNSIEGDLMAPFSRGHRKRYVYSPDGRAAIGYRVVYGVALAGPGPIGAVDARDAALHAWLDRCDERGWRPAMIGADSTARAAARPLGIRGLCIGDEVIADVAPFQLNTPAMRGVRQAVKRTHNAGVEVSIVLEGELRVTERGELAEVADDWQQGRGPRGYAMTLDHLLDHTYHDAVLAIARHHGRVVGFQRYFVCRGGTGLTLDVMPRRRSAPNGVNERLIVDAIEWARDRDITELSLNFAAFRTLFEAEPTPAHRSLRRVVHLLDRFLNVESLYRFNAKFHPTWNPRHLLFRYPLDIPFVLAAALRIEFGPRGRLDRPTTVAVGATERA
ncbi:MAG: phosphatidylglycerol lysyltransferase domain-containing protein [Actinomycetota bacterium]